MYRYDADELENMANGIVAAIRKYAIPINELTDQEIWQELQKSGYRFPIGAAKYGDTTYDRIYQEYYSCCHDNCSSNQTFIPSGYETFIAWINVCTSGGWLEEAQRTKHIHII